MTANSDIPEGTVTVLFTDLVGSTELNQQLGDETSRTIGRAVERLVLEHVANHRGVPIKEMGDGVMAAFASARRAVTCAREIQRAMAERNRREPTQTVQMRIGLHTGEVISENGDIHGETVIIAKRIESLAPVGCVFASATVHMVLGTARDEFEDRGEFELKGIATPWRLYELPCGEPDEEIVLPDRMATPYVGRRTERDRVFEFVTAAAGGTGGIVLISGEAGAGKSRLAAEALEEARRHRMLVMTGNCLDLDVPPPYQPLIDQIEQAAAASTPERMRVAIGENAPELAKLMPVLRQRYDDIAEPPSLPPEQERQYLLQGVQAFLERSAKARPLVLVFEDLHWADESSLLLLEHLAPRLASIPLLVIGTYRHTDLDLARPFNRTLANLLRARQAVEVPLRLLSREEITQMLGGRAGQAPPAELVDLVESETDGNPFFVEEVFRHLHEAGKLFDASGQWLGGIAIGETEVPRGVQRVIGRRLERLSANTRRILANAAVIGRTFSFDLLLAVSGASEDAVFDALEEAEPLGLISEVPGQREAQYVFVHEQFRQSLLADLSLPRRQRLHVRVADALEAITIQNGSRAVVAIANHLELSGAAAPSDRTADALIASGRAALDSLAFEDALRVLQRAATYIDHVERRAVVFGLQAQALRGSGDVDEAFAVLDRALANLSGMADVRAAVLLQRAQLLLDLFRAEPTLDDLGLVIGHHRSTGDRHAELDAVMALARAHYIMSLDRRDYADRARSTAEEALQLAEQLADKHAMTVVLLRTSWFTDYWADYRPTAVANIARALRLSKELGDEDLIIEARAASLRVNGIRDDNNEADELRQQLEARRDPIRLKEHCFLMMWHYLGRGQFVRCVEVCDRGIELAAQLGSAPVQYGSIKALALIELGRFDAVDGAIAQEVTDDEHPFGQAIAEMARATYLDRIEAREAAIAAAVHTFGLAIELSRIWMQRAMVTLLTSLRTRMQRDGEFVPPVVAEVIESAAVPPSRTAAAHWLAYSGSLDEAYRVLTGEVDHLGATDQRQLLTRTEGILAETCLLLGRAGEAETVSRRGLDAAERMEQASVTWQLRRVLAGSLDAQSRVGEADEQRALASVEVSVLAARIADPILRERFLTRC